MLRVSFRSLLISLLFVSLQNFINAVAETVAIKNFYYDNTAAGQNIGTKHYPFLSLSNLPQLLKDIKTATAVNVYLKPTNQAYSIQSDPSYAVDPQFIRNLTFMPWDPQIVQTDGDCDLLPIVNGTSFYLKLTSIPYVSFTGVRFIQMGGSIQIKGSQQVAMADLCLDDGVSVSNNFFTLKDNDDFILQRTIVTLANGSEIINFSHSGAGIQPKSARIEDITLNFLNNAHKIRLETQSQAYFRFNFQPVENSPELTINNLSFKNKGRSQVFPQIFDISGWEIVSLKGLNMTDQSFHISCNGAFQFKDITLLTLQNSLIFDNAIYSQVLVNSKERISLFYLKNVDTLNLSDTMISENFINGSSNLENNFRFFQIEDGLNLMVNNISVAGNECYILAYIIRFKTENSDSSTSLDFQNIKIDSNNATDNIFYLLRFSNGKINAFTVKNISITNNRFSSRIFDIYTVADANLNGQHLSDVEISHTTFDFDDISIANNENLLNFGLLILFVGNPPSLPPDYVPDYEYYSVTIDNLNITNNTFRKGQDTDLTDQLSVIQVAGAQLYIEDSVLADSAFISFDFVSMYRELSSVFFVNSVVNNTNFTEANFMITRYEALMVTKGPFFNISRSKREVQAIYRYAFVLDSTFTNMQIQEGSLFTFRNAFLLMSKNTFDSITFIQSFLLNAGKFRPPGSDLANITFVRNPKVEQESLERLNPDLPPLFDRVANSLRALYKPTIYFYTLRSNNMTRLKIYTESIINFEDYQYQQSFICVNKNSFSAFDIPDVATDIMKLAGALQAFNFMQNTLKKLTGDGAILHLSSLEGNRFFEFNENLIQDNKGPSILKAKGTEIAEIIISSNRIFDNYFSNTLFVIDMILHNGNIIFLENIFINNTLTVDDGDLNTMNSFIKLAPKPPTKRPSLFSINVPSSIIHT